MLHPMTDINSNKHDHTDCDCAKCSELMAWEEDVFGDGFEELLAEHLEYTNRPPIQLDPNFDDSIPF